MSKNNSRNYLSPKIVSLSHIGGRSTQQDQLSPSPDEPYSFDGQSDLLLVVADGAGGHQGGDVASQIVIETVVKRYGTLRQQQKPKQALVNAIRDAHESIQDHQVADFEKQNMASTVVALVLTPLSQRNGKSAYEICVANVGDSRAYRYRPKLPLKQLSQDHTLVQEEVRQQHLTPEQAKIHPLRHRLSQALGGKKKLNIFTRAVSRTKKHDRYLLCTDGLTDVLDDAHIQTILSERAGTEQVAKRLMKQALLHAEDNVSFILLDIMPLSPDKRRLLAMSMIQSWLGKMVVVLLLALMIAFTMTVLLTQ